MNLKKDSLPILSDTLLVIRCQFIFSNDGIDIEDRQALLYVNMWKMFRECK